MGAAGDMLAAALAELLPEPEALARRMNALGIPGVTVSLEKAVKCGITGTRFRVEAGGVEEDAHLHDYPGHHHHSSMAHIRELVQSLPLPTMVKLDVLAVYQRIAEAESHVHGVPVGDIHFHEVGAMDAVADISAVCLALYELKVERIVVSPVHVGSGSVRCAHGVLPVPAPATAHILRGVPIYGGGIAGELCTPTGAALIRHFAGEFGQMPVMQVEAVGYGMGKKDFERANCVRVLLGESAGESQGVLKLECNVDDMTGEAIGFALEQLLDHGALDAFTVPVGMKKSRPGTLLCVLCREADRDALVGLLFRHTTTLGIRETRCVRYTLDRRVEALDTPCGRVRRKVSTGYGVRREKYEYEDLARIARERQASLEDVVQMVRTEEDGR